jgi:hypothetical protein
VNTTRPGIAVRPSDQPNGTLICTLIDRRSSLPMSDARITCVVGFGKIVQVDADQRGEFRADMPEGVYELIISARGELALILRGIGILAGHTQYITRAFAPGDEEPNDGEPSSAIGGYLTDRLGQPFPRAAVTATAGKGAHRYATQSDQFGAYIFHNVKPDEYDVVVRSATGTLSNERIMISGQREFYRHDLRLMVTA